MKSYDIAITFGHKAKKKIKRKRPEKMPVGEIRNIHQKVNELLECKIKSIRKFEYDNLLSTMRLPKKFKETKKKTAGRERERENTCIPFILMVILCTL